LNHLPTVSVIIACRNEGEYIHSCLYSVVNQSYPLTEIIVIDGCSTDDTWGTCDYYRKHYGIRLLSNPKRITPISWNIGIKSSTGDLVMILGAHSTYPQNYIEDHVHWSEKTGAANVGGLITFVPRTNGLLAEAFTVCKSDKFGTGKSDFRLPQNDNTPIPVETVFGGCYRRDAFSKTGYFNEQLQYSSDLEFNLRLKSAGLDILLIPSITSSYFTRSTLFSFLRNAYKDGKWVVLPFKYSNYWPLLGWRLVPALFALFLPFTMIPYFILSFYRALKVAVSKRDIRFLPVMMFVFFVFHLSYGTGSLSALFQLLGNRS